MMGLFLTSVILEHHIPPPGRVTQYAPHPASDTTNKYLSSLFKSCFSPKGTQFFESPAGDKSGFVLHGL